MDMGSYLKLRGYLQLILFGKGNINFLQWHFNGNNNASGQVFWTTQNEHPGAFIDFYFAFFFMSRHINLLLVYFDFYFEVLCSCCFIFMCLFALKREKRVWSWVDRMLGTIWDQLRERET